MPLRRPSFRPFLLGLALAVVWAGTACREREKPVPPTAAASPAAAPAVENPTLETLYGILGQADAANAGIDGLQGGPSEWIVLYRFPDVREKGLAERIGAEMAPKIQALYRRYRDLDRVVFRIEVLEKSGGAAWRGFFSFVTTRRSVDDIDWPSLPLNDFLKKVLDLKVTE